MKKSYSKPTAEVEVFSVKNMISVSAIPINKSPSVVKYTKGKLNF